MKCGVDNINIAVRGSLRSMQNGAPTSNDEYSVLLVQLSHNRRDMSRIATTKSFETGSMSCGAVGVAEPDSPKPPGVGPHLREFGQRRTRQAGGRSGLGRRPSGGGHSLALHMRAVPHHLFEARHAMRVKKVAVCRGEVRVTHLQVQVRMQALLWVRSTTVNHHQPPRPHARQRRVQTAVATRGATRAEPAASPVSSVSPTSSRPPLITHPTSNSNHK
ncbi:hypothetical protein BC830DRAFT_407013 [Chytriomyces sp. MP71]|nr:hypothetical protein BC830DRAFT_407013 [Chytriomyces sp. MP71]